MNEKQTALRVLNDLETAGFKAFLVGGCVRDQLIGRNPKDFDVCTSATPDQIENVFQNFQTLEVGKKFGIVTVVIDHEPIEIATFRADVFETSDGRHPSEVTRVQTIEEDLARRDFTMNAMAMSENGDVVDPFGGLNDVRNRVIRFVGDPSTRLNEDSLRALRAVRFQSQLGFDVEDGSLRALNGVDLNGVSQERITQELTKILTGDFVVKAMRTLKDTGLLWKMVPELERLLEPHDSPWHLEADETGNSIWAHVIRVLEGTVNETSESSSHERLVVRLSGLFHDIGKPVVREPKGDHSRFLGHDVTGAKMTKEILTRMRFPSDVIAEVSELVRMHMNMHDIGAIKKVTAARKLLGRKDIENLLKLARSDDAATVNDIEVAGGHIDLMSAVGAWRDRFPVMLPKPILTGLDLIEAGAKPSKEFGKVLEEAFNDQLNGVEDKHKLLSRSLKKLVK